LSNNCLEVKNLSYQYQTGSSNILALNSVDLLLRNGELIGLLGPSGCGKTTLLRLIAGFEKPTNGKILIENKVVATSNYLTPPEHRGVGMVFQDYALFPHLNTWRNACFGLRRGKNTNRVEWLLELLGLSDLRSRYPHELSGGQRQRLALARALAPGTSIVVLDEPFSNLDVDVRLKLRCELAAVLKTCSASAILVTHDPDEALAICDRVAVMCEGRIHQCSTPSDLVHKPATSFVARFVLQRNVIPIEVGREKIYTPFGTLSKPSDSSITIPHELMLDDQCLELIPNSNGLAEIIGCEFQGQYWLLRVAFGELRLRIRYPLEKTISQGCRCDIRFRSDKTGLMFPGSIRIPLKLCS